MVVTTYSYSFTAYHTSRSMIQAKQYRQEHQFHHQIPSYKSYSSSHQIIIRRRQRSMVLQMDVSSATWFRVGDRIKVISSVMKSGYGDLKGREGVVIETWEKCDVDPTCCCAEFVDENYAVNVQFDAKSLVIDDDDCGDGVGVDGGDTVESEDNFTSYFAEAEIVKVDVE